MSPTPLPAADPTTISAAERRSPGWPLPVVAAATLLSAAGLWWGTGLEPIWGLTWLAPWPVLAAGLRTSAWRAGLAAGAAWALGGLNLWHYERSVIGMPAPIALAALALPALAFAAGALLLRTLAHRGRALAASLALPAFWTSLELLTSRVSPHGSFGSLAYTQLACLPIVQLASLFGSFGISFLLLLVPSALATLSAPFARQRGRVAILTIGALTAVLGYGAVRLTTAESGHTPLTIGLVAADRPEQPVAIGTADGDRLTAAYVEATHALAASGAELVVWPETALRLPATAIEPLGRRLADATGGRAAVVVGADAVETEGARTNAEGPGAAGAAGEANSALVFPAGGVTPSAYVKQHLLLPPEARYRPGTEPRFVALPSGSAEANGATGVGSAGVAICKDLDFPTLGRLYAQGGAALLLAPAWDFGVDGWLHSRMAVLRGVEGGFAVARSARSGRLTVSDDRGRVVAEARSDSAPVASLLATVNVGRAATPYARLGDSLDALGCGLVLLVAALALRR